MGTQDFKPTELAFRRLMEAAPDGVVIVDGRGRMVFVNRQANEMFGYDGDELVGQAIEVLVPERFRRTHVGQRDGYIRHPRPRLMAGGLRLFGRRKDGLELPVEIALSPIETEAGVLTTAFIRDVTDRVRSEDLAQQAIRLEADRRAAAAYAQKLAVNEARYRSFVLATATITWAVDARGRMQESSPSLEAYTGLPFEALAGDGWMNALHPDDRPRMVAEWAPQEGGTRWFDTEYRLRRHDGVYRWFWARAVPLLSPEGEVLEWVGASNDITERKEAEGQLRQFELLVQSVVDYAIVMLDPEGRITTWNDGAERLEGYTEAEAIGRHIRVFYGPEDIEADRPGHTLLEATRKGRASERGWRRRQDGTTFWAEIDVTAIRDGDGRLLGFAHITRDVTEARRFEEQSRQMEALQQAQVLKDQFLSILSHELRTPINAIMGFASVLEDGLAGPLSVEQATYVGRISGGADILLALIDDLLDMSRIQAGQFTLDRAPIAFPPIVHGVVDQLSAIIAQKSCRIAVEVPDDLPMVVADRQRIQQVLTNLVSNAIKYSFELCGIAVRARVEGDRLRCEVEDAGIGIAPENIPRLFNPFVQLDMSATRRKGGAGLGLSIVRAIVEAHGGEVGVTSTVGVGSTFWFTLPLGAPTA